MEGNIQNNNHELQLTLESTACTAVVHNTRTPSRYLEWMTVRLGGFRDELLAACTETLLSAPVGLLGGDLAPLVPALKIALTSGASHLPTAAVAVGALERWREETLPLLQPHLAEVKPAVVACFSRGSLSRRGPCILLRLFPVACRDFPPLFWPLAFMHYIHTRGRQDMSTDMRFPVLCLCIPDFCPGPPTAAALHADPAAPRQAPVGRRHGRGLRGGGRSCQGGRV